MRITIWGINYYPELIGIGVYNNDLCKFLTARGHKVNMVTGFPYYPQWKKLPKDEKTLYRTEISPENPGLTVFRCWLYVPAQQSAWLRIWHEASFVLTSFCRVLNSQTPDVYIVISPPLLLGIVARLMAFIKPAPIVLHIQDLQPDAAVSLGMLKPGLLVSCLRVLEKLAYRGANLVSSISEEMCQNIRAKLANKQSKLVRDEKVFFLPNWVCLPIPEQAELYEWKRKHNIAPSMPIISYAGNLGIKQGIDIVIEAARFLEGKQECLIVIAGNGGQESYLKQLAIRYNLGNLLFLDVLPEDEHTALLIDSAVCLIPQRSGSADNFLPSKLLKILALGRPVVTNSDKGSSLCNAALEGGFGSVVYPGDSQAMAQAIIDLLADSSGRDQMQILGQKYVEQFERQRVLSKLEATLDNLVKKMR